MPQVPAAPFVVAGLVGAAGGGGGVVVGLSFGATEPPPLNSTCRLVIAASRSHVARLHFTGGHTESFPVNLRAGTLNSKRFSTGTPSGPRSRTTFRAHPVFLESQFPSFVSGPEEYTVFAIEKLTGSMGIHDFAYLEHSGAGDRILSRLASMRLRVAGVCHCSPFYRFTEKRAGVCRHCCAYHERHDPNCQPKISCVYRLFMDPPHCQINIPFQVCMNVAKRKLVMQR